MERAGLLETMARADLEAVVEAASAGYHPGTLDLLNALDPGWRAALDRAEREVGALYAGLCQADVTLRRWRQAVGELRRLWLEVRESPAEALDEVA